MRVSDILEVVALAAAALEVVAVAEVVLVVVLLHEAVIILTIDTQSSGGSLGTGMNILIMFGVGAFLLFMLIKYLSDQNSSSGKSYGNSTGYNVEPILHRRVENNTLAINRVHHVIQTLMRMLSLHGLEKFTSNYRQPGLKKIGIWCAHLKVLASILNTVLNWKTISNLKQRNVLERVYVENVRIKDFYENPDGNDTLVVILSSTLRDYVIEDKTRKVIEGDPQQDLFTVLSNELHPQTW